MQIEEVLKNLRANNFAVQFAKSREIAEEIILNMISKDAVVGVGDSATIRQIGILKELEKRGTKILNPFSRKLTTDPNKLETRNRMSIKIFTCDILVTGTNAVTTDGKLVNIDAVGNRVAAMIFGPKKVIIVVGRNKIVKDTEVALHRIKNVIAPYHAKTKDFATPCAQTGECSNCSSKHRICNVTTIMEKRPWRTDMTILLIDEDLGLSWDEKWPIERISQIKSNYEKVTWIFASSHTN
jgi:hypothetical protein